MKYRRLLTILILLCCSVAGPVWASPYGVRTWNQHHDFSNDYDGKLTDLFNGAQQLKYDELADPVNKVYRGGYLDAGVWKKDSIAYDWSSVPKDPADSTKPDLTKVKPFTATDYQDIKSGGWHCAPTSYAMAHDYWWNNSKSEIPTITSFAKKMDTNDLNTSMHAGDHELHYGTYLNNQTSAVKQFSPGFPWSGNYESNLLWEGATVPTLAEQQKYFGEIRAGRPAKVAKPGHAQMGIGFDPTGGAIINDPDDGATKILPWDDVRNFVSQQPNRLSDLPAGNRVFFSNDNFGTGQANAQAPGGDPGDIFGSSLTGSYGRMWEDNGGANDYNGSVITNGREYPFDIDGLDVLKTIQPMNFLTYSYDDGDPNPHDWIPGVPGAEGGPSYSAQELFTTFLPTEWYTAGFVEGSLAAVSATEELLGLNRAEWSLPGDPLDDDVDAVDIEFDALFAFSVDFIDTRVFPDYEILDPNGILQADLNGNEFWYELDYWDPTDIYNTCGAMYDGETDIGLSENSDIDAIQFFSIFEDGTIDGLLFSLDGDAPEAMDAWSNLLDPGAIYLSWLDGSAPSFYANMGWDLDAITWSSQPVPEPATVFLFGSGLIALIKIRVGKRKIGKFTGA